MKKKSTILYRKSAPRYPLARKDKHRRRTHTSRSHPSLINRFNPAHTANSLKRTRTHSRKVRPWNTHSIAFTSIDLRPTLLTFLFLLQKKKKKKEKRKKRLLILLSYFLSFFCLLIVPPLTDIHDNNNLLHL